MKAVIFDLDNTLLDRDTSLKHFIKKQYKQFNADFSHIPEQTYCDRFIELDKNGMVWKDIVYQSIVEEFNITTIPWEILLDDYVNNFAISCVSYADVETTLMELQNDGYRMGIISNGKSPFQENNIEALGITKYFQAILISEKEGVRKPAPAIFHKAHNTLGVTAHDAVYIGDNTESDIKGAKEAGMSAIWKKNSSEAHCPLADAVFDDFTMLPDLIRKISE